MSTFLASANSRETSIELMQAILHVAEHNEEKAERMWESPTPQELMNIIAIVTNNGMHPTHHFCWGDAGASWSGISLAEHVVAMADRFESVEFVEFAKQIAVADEQDRENGTSTFTLPDGSKVMCKEMDMSVVK